MDEIPEDWSLYLWVTIINLGQFAEHPAQEDHLILQRDARGLLVHPVSR